MNKYEFYSKLLQEDFPVKYRQDFAEHDSGQCRKIANLKSQLKEIESERDTARQQILDVLERSSDDIAYVKHQLAEAVGLLRDSECHYKHVWYEPHISEVANFLARHAQDEQQEACDYCGPGKHTGLPGGACENCMNTGLKYPEQET